MKFRSGFLLFLPIPLLLLLAMAACSQDDSDVSGPQSLPPPAPTEGPRPLSSDERAAIDEFETQLESIDGQWEEFYSDLDNWRAGLAACLPSAAQESLAGLAGGYVAVVEGAHGLPRTASTKALADLVITAAEAEETAFRHLRDRWSAGNISLFEMVEQRRAESSLARNSVTDMALELRIQFEDGPTFGEVSEMEKFSDTFDGIADHWDDFHDAYAAFAKRESKLEEEERAAAYEQLVAQLGEIMSGINALETTDVNEDLVDQLQEAAEDQTAALQFLADFPPDLTEDEDEKDTAGAPTPTARVASATPAPAPQVPQASAAPAATAPADPAAQAAPAAAQEAAEPEATPEEGPVKKLSPLEEMAAAIDNTEALLEELGQSIEAIVNDKSAENLLDLEKFDTSFRQLAGKWGQFYEAYDEWRSTDGGCDRVEVAKDLTAFSQQAQALARTVRDLPRSGFLVPVYSLTVEAAESESGAIRTLANSWTPFAVDAFKAVDEERVSAGRLRSQAGIALEELRSRP